MGHHIEVLELFEQSEGTRLPQFLNGKWRTPPEDIGGAPGYEHFLEVIKNPNHEEHTEMAEWLDGDFDVNDIDEEIIRIQISRLANMRRIKK